MPETLLKPGRHGNPHGMAGVTAIPLDHRALATLVAGRDQSNELADALERRFDVRPPPRPGWTTKNGIGFVGVGPGRWLAMDEAGDGFAFESALRSAAGGLGAVTDQSDAFLLLRLSGPLLRRALAKGLGIDLHPTIFRPGDAATMPFHLIGATLWRTDDGSRPDGFACEIAVARSYAGSVLHGLADSAAEYGFEWQRSGRG